PRNRVQLSDARRVLQGGGAQRRQQARHLTPPNANHSAGPSHGRSDTPHRTPANTATTLGAAVVRNRSPSPAEIQSDSAARSSRPADHAVAVDGTPRPAPER